MPRQAAAPPAAPPAATQSGCRSDAPDGARIRPSRNARWRALSLIAVHALVAVHLVHWSVRGSTLSPLEPSESMEFVKHGLVNAGLVFFGLTLLSTLVLGRWFCGWACHVVALQDLSLVLLRKLGIQPRPLRSRLLAWVPLGAAVYMFLWPLAYRLVSGLGLPDTHVALTKEDFWGTFPPWPVALATFVVCGGVAIYFLGAKGFCTYGCPYGALYGGLDRFATGRIRVTDACEGCAHCTATCTSNVLVHQEVREHGMVVDPGCMKCLDCVSVCPKGALYFGFGAPALGKATRAAGKNKGGLSWREEALLGTAFVVTFLAYRGLYGVIPFLLALALAAIGAFLVLTWRRMARRPALTLAGRPLVSGGRKTGAGRAFVTGMLALGLLTLHSGAIQLQSRRAEAAFTDLEPVYARALSQPGHQAETDVDERARAGDWAARFLQGFGLLETPGSWAWRARFALVEGRDEDFLQHTAAALERAPSASGHYDLARYFEVRGRVAEAAAQYRAGLDLLPSATIYDRLARLLWGSGSEEQALEVFREAVVLHPENPDLSFNLAVALGALGQLQEAAQAFQRVLDLDPARQDARENLAGLQAAGVGPPPR